MAGKTVNEWQAMTIIMQGGSGPWGPHVLWERILGLIRCEACSYTIHGTPWTTYEPPTYYGDATPSHQLIED